MWSQRQDVVLMDVRMPGTDGVAATHAVINEGLTAQSGQPVGNIILTTYHIDEAVYAALRASASGFLLKDAAPAEIVNAIRAVAASEAWLNPAVTRRLIDEFATRPEQHTPTSAEMAQLTPASGKSSPSWTEACPTPTLPHSCSSAKPPSKHTLLT